MIIYLCDNELFIINKKHIISNKLKSIDKGFIINKEEFINEFLKIIKKEKIKIKLLNNSIKIVNNTYFHSSDLFYLENIFNELGFEKIEFLDIKELLSDNATYLEINNTYLVITNEGIYLDLDYFKDIPKILEYFDKILKNKIILFGQNKIIPLIKVNNKEIFYFDNYQKFVLESLLKVEK